MLNEDQIDEVAARLRKSIDAALPLVGDFRDVERLALEEEDARVIADFVAGARALHNGLGAADGLWSSSTVAEGLRRTSSKRKD